ncbi:MAG TPA: tetratricopeptide repeat protein, partial [Pseudonocardiaceae bacterium]
SVDGLPLALELAAARARVLSLPELAELLAERLDVLAAGPRTARPQHRTLRACVAWSYELLDDEEQALLRALSVVTGSCDLAAVAALCPPANDTPGDDTSGNDASGNAPPGNSGVGGHVTGDQGGRTVLDLVDRLVGRSLLVADRRRTGTRYRMLDTIRRFAAELLARRPDELYAARDRHAEHYSWLVAELDSRLRGADLEHVLDRLAAEHDNLRTAMSWLASGDDPEAALALARAAWQYCYLRGHYAEGRRWLRTALARADGLPPQLVGEALAGAAALAHYACDYPEATALGERALATYRELGDGRGTALALTRLASVAREQADYPRALRLQSDALELFERAGDEWGVGHALQLLGLASWLSGDAAGAGAWSTRALRTLTAVGDKERIAWTLLDRGAGSLYGKPGDEDTARGHLDTARRLFTEVGFQEGLAWADELLALADLRQDDVPAAVNRLTASLRVHHELGDRWRVASVLEALAGVAARLDDAAACGALLAVADGTRAAIGAPVPACERPAVDRTRAWLGGRDTGPFPEPATTTEIAAHLARLRLRAGVA